MDLFIESTARGELTASLFAQLQSAILHERLLAGDRLPASRVVADDLGISRHTVTTVYSRLVAEGYLEGRAGGGTFVRGHPLSRPGASDAVLEPRHAPPYQQPRFPAPPSGDVQFDLRAGIPDPRLFPLAVWRRSMMTALQTYPAGYRHPAGVPVLRRAIAHWIGKSRAVATSPEHVVVTAGAQQAFDLIARVLLAPGDKVAVEDPGYPPFARLCRCIGAQVVAVPVDSEGIVVDEIPSDVRVVYTTPSHQFPTGAVMSPQRRRELLARADLDDFAVIEDDYDSEYRHADRPLEPLHRIDSHSRVAYIGTFSKTLSPSLRLGFAVVPQSLVDSVTELRELSGWQAPETLQLALADFIAGGHLDRHLRRTRKVYTDRHHVVDSFVRALAADGVAANSGISLAGLHTMLSLHPDADERALCEELASAGVAVSALRDCWLDAPGRPGLLLGYGAIEVSRLAEALARLRAVLGA